MSRYKWGRNVYIAKKGDISVGDTGEITTYEEPEQYNFNIQPISGYSDVTIYGDKTIKTYKTMIDKHRYQNQFHEGDVAYLEGASPEGEGINGYNANYIIDAVREQNLKIAIYFNKLQR